MSIDPHKIYKLKGAVQHYAWGGFDFIPHLLGKENSGRQPFAEYWLGAHISAPSQLEDGTHLIPLNKLFADQPQLLGEKTKKRFGQLPYLLKAMDVREMLSIQVHPSKKEAEKGFDAEEERGVDIKSSKRNYKDRNHKPEMLIALSDFWLLHGFKPKAALLETLTGNHQFRSLVPVFEKDGYKGLYTYVMELPQKEVDAMLLPLVQKELRRRSFHESEKTEAGYWVAEYYLNKQTKNIDKGVFSVYFFNLVYLEPGQAIFQAAGLPHAYLQGQNVELMANSDNVLRAGLTEKHMDIPELLKHTRFEPIVPDILSGTKLANERSFELPVPDFKISELKPQAGDRFIIKTTAPEITLCTEGSVIVTGANPMEIKKGETFIAFAGTEYEIAANEPATLYKASVA